MKPEESEYPSGPELRSEIKSLEREGADNMYSIYKRQKKTVKERNTNLEDHLSADLQAMPNVSIQKFDRRNPKRGLQREDGEHPFPVVPKIGPYEVKDPIFGAKNYFWCTCGMSKKQPFCDSSHVGTDFKPMKFSLDSEVKTMHLCGCKLTKNAPFCDATTCMMLATGESFEKIEEATIQEEISDEAAKAQ